MVWGVGMGTGVMGVAGGVLDIHLHELISI